VRIAAAGFINPEDTMMETPFGIYFSSCLNAFSFFSPEINSVVSCNIWFINI
jgi:hypothetical protein